MKHDNVMKKAWSEIRNIFITFQQGIMSVNQIQIFWGFFLSNICIAQ